MMMTGQENMSELEFHPLTRDRWSDLVRLFGERGACGGCWCMWWRLKGSEFEQQKGEGNKKAMRAIVYGGEVPGILAYARGNAIGWCSVAPRDSFPRLNRSRILKKIDETPVWSIVCFFVEKEFRRKGLSVQLLQAAIEYVRQQGGRVIEGYPIEPRKDEMPPASVFTGLFSAFKKAGFVECLRRSETRPIMRYYITGHDSE